MNYFNLTKEQEKQKKIEFKKTRVYKKRRFKHIVYLTLGYGVCFSVLIILGSRTALYMYNSNKFDVSLVDIAMDYTVFLLEAILVIVYVIAYEFSSERLFQDFVNQSK